MDNARHDPGDDRPPLAEEYRRAGPAITLATSMLAGMLLFSGLGFWADRTRGGGMFWTVAGMFLGLAYCVYEVWRTLRLMEDAERERKAGGKPK